MTEVGGCEQRVVSLTYTHYRKKSTHKNWYLIISHNSFTINSFHTAHCYKTVHYPKHCWITKSHSLEREESTLTLILNIFSWVGPVKARPDHGGQERSSFSPRVRVLAWLLQSLQEGCLCWESQNQHPKHGSRERQGGTAGHHLAAVGVSTPRQPQLGGAMPFQNRDLELWDHSTRRQRQRISGHSRSHWMLQGPQHQHSFVSSPFFKGQNGFCVKFLVSLASLPLL